MRLVLVSALVLAAAPAYAESEPTPVQVAEIHVCRDVDRETRAPLGVGDVFPQDVERLYCFTRLTGAGQSAGRFAFLRRAETAAAFTTAIAAVTPGTNFRGVIVAQMGRGFFSRESTFEPIIGHEIAVSYTAGTGSLVIHDQNSGSITQTVSGAAQIAALLAEHVHLRYVENAPVVNGDAMNRGTFSLRVFT